MVCGDRGTVERTQNDIVEISDGIRRGGEWGGQICEWICKFEGAERERERETS